MLKHEQVAELSARSTSILSLRKRKLLQRPCWEALEARVLMSATATWIGGGGDNNFSTAANWLGGATPQNGASIVLSANATSQTVNVDSNVAIGSLTIAGGGYTISGNQISISGGLSATGSSEIDSDLSLASSQTVAISDGTLTLGGNIDDGGNSYGLTKTGEGTLDITGTGTYSGNTDVSAGVLEVDGALSSNITLASGASLDGNGLVGGITSVGGTVSPGVGSNAGLLIDNGGLTLDANSTFSVELDGNSAGTGSNFYGQLSSGNNVTLDGATLNVTVGPDYTPAPGDTLTLISNSGSSTTGTFAGLPEGSTITLGGDKVFRISYEGGAGNDTTLSYIRSTAVTVSSSASPSVTGQSVTFTASVAPADGLGGDPTGTVTFYDGNVAIGSAATLNGGAQATISDSSLTLGSNSITAVYSGDSGYQSATSASFNQTVNAAATTTAVTSSSNNNASVWGQSVTFTAAVATSAPGSGSASGTVQFYADGSPIGSAVTLADGSAGYSTSALAIGGRSITAAFTSTNANFSGSTSSAITQTVAKSTTTTTVTSSSLSSVVGQSVKFTATVAAAGGGAGVRTGTVTFMDGMTTLGTGIVNASGVATFSVSSLALGSHSITAIYGGDSHFLTSTSSSISQVVAQAHTRILVSTSATPAVYGQSVTLSASVAAANPGSGTPTGSVTFNVDGNSIGTVALTAGHASISAGALSVGSHAITVSYTGDSNYLTGNSSTVTELVNQSPTTTSITSSHPTAEFGQTVSYSVTVAATGNGSGTPNGGTVTLTDENNNTVGTGTLANGSVSINVSSLAVGSHTVTATYTNDTDFATSSNSTGQTIDSAATTTAVTGPGAATVAGQSVTFTAAVSVNGPGSAPVDGGSVAFYNNDLQHQIGTTQTVANGSASVTTSGLTHGANDIFAVFTPTNNELASSTSATVVQSDNQAATSTAVTSSDASSAFGESVALTAQVTPTAPGSGLPTGTVTFYDGVAQIGEPVTVSDTGSAELDTGALTVGIHNIKAIYSGNTDYASSDNSLSTFTQTVNQAATATTITADNSPSTFDQSVTFTATVDISGSGAGTRTGSVDFSIDSGSPQTVNLDGDTATITVSNLGVGDHTVDATYNGDTNFAGSSATTFDHTVNESATSTTVNTSDATPVYGEPTTLTATVAATAPGGGTPNAGTVTFYADGDVNSPLGTGTVSGGTATLTGVTLPVGDHGITASYAGDGTDYLGSDSASVDQNISKASTSLTLTAPTTVVFGQSATLTATVAVLGNGVGTPTGNVDFYADGNTDSPIGTEALSSGAASITVSDLPVGTHGITAVYAGDGNFVTSTASSVNQIVNESSTTTTVTSDSTFSNNAYNSVYGQTVNFTATVAASGAGVGTPTGTVTFSDGNVTLGTATLSGGVATLSSTSLAHYLALGDHTITASYAGDGVDFIGSDSTGSPITQDVAQASTTSSVTSSLGTSAFGQGITLTATVATQLPGHGTPGHGTVTFYDGVNQIGTGQLHLNGTATLHISDLSVATHSITVTYSGDTNNATSTSSAFTQTVNPVDTGVTLTSSDSAPVSGETVTLTATVAPVVGAQVPTGTVTFYDNSVAIGSANALTSGQVAITTILPLGANSLTASYTNVDGNFYGSSTASPMSDPVSQDAVTVGATSSVNPTVYGQSSAFTATVAAAGNGSGTPTGTVQFYADGNAIGAPVTLNSGVATLNYGALPATTHDISATYSGDTDFLTGSTPASSLSQVVNEASTTVTLGSTTASTFGGNATLTATVAPVGPGAGTPTGTVYFYADQNNTPIGQATLSSGVATLQISSLAEGDHVITASYAGDDNFIESSSNSSVTQHVNQSHTATTLQVASSNVFGQSITFTATVAASGGGGGTPLGTVFFLDSNNNDLGTASLVNGQAVLTDANLAVGTYAIRAVYASSDDTNYLASNSSASSVAVNQAATTVGLTSSTNPSVYDQSTTFTATVAVTSPGSTHVTVPTGTVTFYDNGTSIGSGSPDANGVVTLSTSSLAVSQSSHPITATYSGDSNFLGSTSSTLNQTVNKANVGVAVTSTAQNSAVFGQSVTLTATITATAGTPTGTVTFYDGGTQIGSPVTVANGSASISTSALTTAAHTITATYNGDGNFNTQTSANFSQVINQSSTATAVVADHNPAVSGQTVDFTATVTAAGLGAGTPTGTVTFFDGNTQIGSPVSLSGNTASISTSALTTAGHTITATYNGDGNFLTSSSPSLSQSENQDASSVSLDSAGLTSVYGANPTLTATVSANTPGSGTPTGTVTFYDGTGNTAVALGQASLSGGVATLSSYALAAGSHTLSAVYSGDTNFVTSISATTDYSVTPAATSVALTGDTAGEYGQPLTVTATVSDTTGSGTATGSIEFFDNSTLIGTVPMTAGAASLTQGYTVGSHPITATYVPSGGNFSGSTTVSAQTVAVVAASTSTTLAPTTATVFGQPATFTATVTISGNGVGTFSGQVSFYDGNTLLGSSNVANGQASLATVSPLNVGDHTITAVYNSDPNFANSTASAVTQTVNESATTTTVSSSDATAVYGEQVTLTAAVAATAPGAGTPNSGTVTFYADGNLNTPLGTGTVSNGSATLTGVTLPVGDHGLTASYAGDGTNFLSSTSASADQNFAKASTSLTLATPTNVVYGQSATLTATIGVLGNGAGTPTGNVVFYADGNTDSPIGTEALSSGSASINISSLPVGTHGITATYVGDSNFATSAATNVNQVVNQAASTTTVTSNSTFSNNAYNSVFGQPVTFTAAVAASGAGVGTPTGTVTFSDGNVTLGTATLSGGVATLSSTTLAHYLTVGNHSITASYAGDTNFTTSDSTGAPITQDVALASTTATLTSSGTSTFGQDVTLTATIASQLPGHGTPTHGTVTFYSDNVQIGSPQNVTSGVATLDITSLSVATHSITAVYSGDTGYATSTASAISQTVNKATPAISLGSTDQNNAVFGEPVTLTAAVTSGAGTPTGTVTFYDGGTQIGSPMTVTNGSASITTSALTTATHIITATYSGDGSFNTLTSANFSQVTGQSSTTTAVVADYNPAVSGQTVDFTATVTPTGPGAGTPTGTVTFYADGTALGDPVTMTGNTASISTSVLSTEGHLITATYNGDGNFLTSTSPSLSQSQNQDASSVSLDSAGLTSVYGANPTLTATVSANTPGSGTPTGTVTFYDGSGNTAVSLGQGTITGGVATLTNYTLAAGSHTLSAVYSGDINFVTSTSATTNYSVTPATTSVALSGATAGEFGQPLTVTATVSDTTGSGTPTGSLEFFDNSTLIGTVPMTAGAASLTQGYTVASHPITATYIPSGGNFSGSTTASAQTIAVVAASTSTTLASPTSTVFGQPATFTAAVAISGNGVGTLTGQVSFYDGNTLLGSSNVANGQASFTTTLPLSVANHSITAVYNSDPNFANSTSTIRTEVVAKDASTVALATTPSPILPGGQVTLTATVGAATPGAGTATGSVQFFDGQTSLGTSPLTSGVATLSTTTLAGGTHSITATYLGDGNFTTSTSTASSVHIALPGVLQFGSATYTANESGGTASVTVTRTGGTEGAVGVSYAVTGGTAVDGTDYTLSSGTLSFTNGQSSNTITIPISNDGKFGNDKTVVLSLSTPTGSATLGSATGSTLTIHDDNPEPTLSVSSPTVTEAANGTAVATFTVTLSAASDLTTGVNYSTVNGSVTAASGDYVAKSGSLTFAPGVTTKQVSVNINGTSTPGTNQTFSLSLSSPSNATLLHGTGTATIVNNNFTAPAVTNVGVTVTPGSNAILLPLSSAVSHDGDPLTLSLLTQPSQGTASVVTVNGVQELSYTPAVGAIESDSFTYKVTDGHGDSSTGTATVTYQGVGIVASELNSALTDLVVIGTSGNDTIKFTQGTGSNLKVTYNGAAAGTFAPTGRVLAFGEGGSNTITAAGVTRSCWFYGGTGNNTLTGGSGNDILIGGPGNDTITGGGGRNILIGANGTDTLKGTSSDILIAAATIYDANTAANQTSLNTILTAWINHQKSTIPTVSGANGGPAFSDTTIAGDDSSDVLIGNKNSWYIGDFTFDGGNTVFSDGRHVKKGHTLLPTAKELVTVVPS